MADADELLIHRYYECFNARRVADGGALVSPDCEFNHLATRDHARGPRGYAALVDDWVKAAPDVTLEPEQIVGIEPGTFRVVLRLRGHFDGPFDIGPMALNGDGQAFDFVGIHQVVIRAGLIVASTFSYDRKDLAGWT